jgi:hypothetical protein
LRERIKVRGSISNFTLILAFSLKGEGIFSRTVIYTIEY